MKQVSTHRKQAGFTIVELMIATAVFSTVLLLCAVAIVHVGRMYYKGSITSRTQDTARKLGEDVSQAVQFGVLSSSDTEFRDERGPISHTNGTQTVGVQSLCLGTVRYSYVLGTPMGTAANQSRHVLWKDRIAPGQSCDPQNLTLQTPSTGGQEILSERMRVARFDVDYEDGMYVIKLTVSYGDTDDLFDTPTAEMPEMFGICKGVNAGGQFCAVARYNTVAGKRL